MDGFQSELLRDFQEAGVYEFAEELGIIGVEEGPDGPAAALLRLSPQHGAGMPGGNGAAARARAALNSRKRAADAAQDEEATRAYARQGPTPPKKKPSRASRTTPSVDKTGKGLRHFSMKVCEKVESKGRTTSNEVADELVAEFSHPDYASEQQFDEKNIRRRVYDALNVLMAMNIISKEKKDITWRGLPTNPDADLEALRAEKIRVRLRLDKKERHLSDLVDQHTAFASLLQRNAAARSNDACPPPGSRIALPFILVQTMPSTLVEVSMSEDEHLVHFDFNDAQFQIHNDAFVLLSSAPGIGAA